MSTYSCDWSVADFLVAVSFVSTQGRHTPALSLWHTIRQIVEWDKLDVKSCRVSILVVWSWMKRVQIHNDVISSLLEKDNNIIRAHYFKNKKSMGL